MSDWVALRRRAYQQHRQLASGLVNAGPALPSADALLKAAEDVTGVPRFPVAPDDALLAGAHAVLDRDIPAIWYADATGNSAALHRFAQAHEFAHYWLHPGVPHDACLVEDTSETLTPTEGRPHTTQIAVGYGVHERREQEANLFAAELLLPAPVLRALFVDADWSAGQIAAHTGLSETLVLSQLANALLMPAPASEKSDAIAPPFPSPPREQSVPTMPAFPLDESQQTAAHIPAGPVLVDAGPGTGKTRTLIARILHLLHSRDVAPENILALTFSNKAAEEMRSRLRDSVGDVADRVWLGTFHAFGYEILRKDGYRIGLPLAPRLLDVPDAVALLERNLDRLQLRELEFLHYPALAFPDILSCISRAKDELRDPSAYLASAEDQYRNASDDRTALQARKSLEIAQVYAVYQQLLAGEGALDFGDLLMRPVELLDRWPEVTERWRQQYTHILADEYQDINRASAHLLRRLAGDGQGFWAVGDLRQAIYRFRGASPANVREFERDFPGGQRLRLEVNYRSRPALVGLFSAAATQMPSEAGTTHDLGHGLLWHPHRGDSDASPILHAVAQDETAEADGIASSIREWEQKGVPPGEQAILCHTNRQAEQIAERLELRGIPVQHIGDLFDRSEVKDLLALISLATESTGTALARVARFPEYAIPPKDVSLVLEAVKQAGLYFPDALATAWETPQLSPIGQDGLRLLWGHLKPLVHHGDAWSLLVRYLFGGSGYLRPLLSTQSTANRQKLLAIHLLLRATQDFRLRRGPGEEPATGKDFLAHLRHLLACGQPAAPRFPSDSGWTDAVRLMTIHQSKGLEFPVVYLPNLAEGQFPSRMRSRMVSPPPGLNLLDASDDGAGEQEEASQEDCLFFVALSRARDAIVLSRAASLRGKAVGPSPYLVQLAPALNALAATETVWRREKEDDLRTEPAADEHGVTENERPNVSLSALEQYRDCPRQYFYQRIEYLPSRADSIYQAFHRSLREAVRWVQTEREAGREPRQENAQAELERIWAESGPDLSVAHARVLYQRAQSLVAGACRTLPSKLTTSAETRFTADLPNGQVTLPPEDTRTLPDGTLQITRYINRRAKKDDHTDPRLALLRHAAKQQSNAGSVEIKLVNLHEGSEQDVPEKARYEPARVAKYDEALRGIRAGDFPPQPDDHKCALCPFFFICPI